MPLHWKAWQGITHRYGLVFSEERFYALGGVPSRDILKMLGREQGVTLDAIAVAREKEEAYLPLIAEVQPIRPILEIVQHHFPTTPMAVATGGHRRIVERLLAHLGMAHYFSTVVASEDVVRQKPAPDIFLEAARRLGVAPETCRAFEDTELGLQAIRSAGMEAVDVRLLLGQKNPPGNRPSTGILDNWRQRSL